MLVCVHGTDIGGLLADGVYMLGLLCQDLGAWIRAPRAAGCPGATGGGGVKEAGFEPAY